MNILFICHRIPYPPNKGEKIRSFNILRYLCSHHDVYLAFLIDDRKDMPHIETLRPMVNDLCWNQIHPKTKKLRSVTAFLKSKPISVPYFYSSTLQKKIDDILDRHDIDTIFCSSSPTAEYVFRSKRFTPRFKLPVEDPGVGAPRLIMDFIDMDSYKWRQYAKESFFPLRLVYDYEAKHLLEYETRIADVFHHCFFTSDSEKDLFLEYTSCKHISAIGNGVDTAFFNPTHKSPHKKKGRVLVFTGAMDYRPNIDGIIWFTENIFPKVQNKIQDLMLYIVGNHPVPDVVRLGQKEGVVVTGFVDDIRDYISLADVCVIPLRIARGVQNKVLEALSMGKPTVCTPQALTGIAAIPDRDVAVAADEVSFSSRIISFCKNEATADTYSRNARKYIEAHHRWEDNLSALEAIL